MLTQLAALITVWDFPAGCCPCSIPLNTFRRVLLSSAELNSSPAELGVSLGMGTTLKGQGCVPVGVACQGHFVRWAGRAPPAAGDGSGEQHQEKVPGGAGGTGMELGEQGRGGLAHPTPRTPRRRHLRQAGDSCSGASGDYKKKGTAALLLNIRLHSLTHATAGVLGFFCFLFLL